MGLINKIKTKFNEMFPDESDPAMPVKLSIIMQDGTVEEYPEGYHITDGINCVCASGVYHTHFDCPILRDERRHGMTIRAMARRDAEREGKIFCYKCEQWDRAREEEE